MSQNALGSLDNSDVFGCSHIFEVELAEFSRFTLDLSPTWDLIICRKRVKMHGTHQLVQIILLPLAEQRKMCSWICVFMELGQ